MASIVPEATEASEADVPREAMVRSEASMREEAKARRLFWACCVWLSTV
jgi:hypothetical protein